MYRTCNKSDFMKKKILSALILVALIILVVFYLKDRVHELKSIFEVNLIYILLILFSLLMTILCDGLKFKVLMDFYDINLKFKEWYGLPNVATFLNYLSPFRAGLSVRAIYLKKKYNFPYTISASTIGMTGIVSLLCYGLLGIVLSFIIQIPFNYKVGFIIFFASTFLIIAAVLFLLPLIPKTNIKILNYVIKSIHELKHIRSNKEVVSKLVVLDMIRLCFYSLRIYFAFKAYNVTVPVFNCFMAGIFATFSYILAITPMGLGVRESLIILVARLSGVSTLFGLYAGILSRVIPLVSYFILGPIFSFMLVKKFWFKSDQSIPVKNEKNNL